MTRYANRLAAGIFTALLAIIPLTAQAASHQLASGGKTKYVIIVDPQATASEQHAAKELASFLQQVTGAEFPLVTTTESPKGPALIVGPGRVASQVAPQLKWEALKPDGIAIESVGDRIVLMGDRPRGTLYAVYTFLEDVVGCRWWTSQASTIPNKPNLSVSEQHVRHVPPLEYREVFWFDSFDGDWAARNKSNGNTERLDEKHGGKIRYGGSFFVHTFAALIPPEEFFKSHPEYFSEVDGKRLDGYAQVCVTNEEVKQLITARVLAHLRTDPTAQIISVSQNDCDNHCLCANCRKLEDEEGSPAGPLLHLVNYVAAEVAKEFPNVAVDTLAYQYTRKAPRHVKPLPNVIIRLCSIECDFSQPLTAPSNQKFADDIRDWSNICQRLYIWDYTTNFSHYIQPHPNLRVLGPNIRFFVDHGVRGIFEQGGYTSPGAEFAELKAGLLRRGSRSDGEVHSVDSRRSGSEENLSDLLQPLIGRVPEPVDVNEGRDAAGRSRGRRQWRSGTLTARASCEIAAALYVGRSLVRVPGSGGARKVSLARPSRLHTELPDVPGCGQGLRSDPHFRRRSTGEFRKAHREHGPHQFATPAGLRNVAARAMD